MAPDHPTTGLADCGPFVRPDSHQKSVNFLDRKIGSFGHQGVDAMGKGGQRPLRGRNLSGQKRRISDASSRNRDDFDSVLSKLWVAIQSPDEVRESPRRSVVQFSEPFRVRQDRTAQGDVDGWVRDARGPHELNQVRRNAVIVVVVHVGDGFDRTDEDFKVPSMARKMSQIVRVPSFPRDLFGVFEMPSQMIRVLDDKFALDGSFQ